jgi:hypothetical protein
MLTRLHTQAGEFAGGQTAVVGDHYVKALGVSSCSSHNDGQHTS